MWKFLYDYLLQTLSGKQWNVFIAQSQPNQQIARLLRSKFQTDIYSSSVVVLLLITILILVFYYHVLNRFRGTYYGRRTWFIWMAVSFALVFTLTYLNASLVMKSFFLPVGGYLFWLSMINGIYSIILYFVLSFLVRLGSPAGSNTPSFKS